MELRVVILLLATLLVQTATAQFGFFDQMFGGQQQQHQQRQQQQNVRSDSSWYQAQYENAHCDKYLCPGTLSCVHFPHHCPCAWESVEDKVELGEGLAVCASKGGYKDGETLRKIELARKGLL
ncbi:hypothetical protein P171DRAFT_481596 [Karstenula rhodostoma CBS 690.94]|uniref:Long chronological lifespan protein 2 n=1 Tax=Karstenula rhodostoma CBS 690.94 TaxID=1392251 RepID=A0A9P4PSP0_9PLEO|nr:hypothetical protein P171DRAFT_481596 [Karstenula rhodostoma CBS 690.94]